MGFSLTKTIHLGVPPLHTYGNSGPLGLEVAAVACGGGFAMALTAGGELFVAGTGGFGIKAPLNGMTMVDFI